MYIDAYFESFLDVENEDEDNSDCESDSREEALYIAGVVTDEPLWIE
jgi:hypothetical protein